MTVISFFRRYWFGLAVAVVLATLALVFHRPLLAWITGHEARGASTEAVTTRCGDVDLVASLRPDPPRERGNALLLSVTRADGTPVDEAEVTVRHAMPAMGTMPEMSGTAQVIREGGGRYTARFDLPMSGTWTLDVDVEAPGVVATARYTLTVGVRRLKAVDAGVAPAAAASSHAHSGEAEVAYYTCPMHPSVRQHDAGTCPTCSMTLAPVTSAELQSGTVQVDEDRRRQAGVRTVAVRRERLTAHVRAAGRVTYDERRVADVSVKVQGWIRKLYVNEPGQEVRAGQPLLALYSPEIVAAEEELLAVVASQETAASTSAPHRVDDLVAASRSRLLRWDMSAAQVDEIVSTGRALEAIPILAPVSGHVVVKDVVEGAAVEPGQRLFRIARLDRVWVEADVYEHDLPLVSVGQEATVSLTYLPDTRLTGRLTFVYPYLDASTRTGRVRVELDNRGLLLKPDMFADVELTIDRGERLVVPESAVLYAGPRRLVFVDVGEGRLKPQEIEVGLRGEGGFEVVRGLEEGDVVVTSANFLVAAESRLKSAIEQWR